MTLWLDAQLSPLLAAWLNWKFDVQAVPVRDLGLRDAEDEEIFHAAKQAGVVMLTKDADFPRLLARFGPPPQVLWLTTGNTSTSACNRCCSRSCPPLWNCWPPVSRW